MPLYAIAPTVLRERARESTLLLDTRTGRYFELDDVGTRMLDLVCESRSIETVLARLAEEFDAPADLLASDLNCLVEDLERHGLLERTE